MAKCIQITILGDPKAQKRAKACQIAGHINIYDPSAKDKGDLLRIIQDKAPEKPFSNPLALTICYFMPRPKQHYGTGKNAGKLKDNAPIWCSKKPDLDNLVKFLTDAMNKIFFYDDSQICKLTAMKIYDEKPRTEILIEELNNV
jgi:Holliday junction resolvase RusA-like endonuclease